MSTVAPPNRYRKPTAFLSPLPEKVKVPGRPLPPVVTPTG
jgi:hypothetical protein